MWVFAFLSFDIIRCSKHNTPCDRDDCFSFPFLIIQKKQSPTTFHYVLLLLHFFSLHVLLCARLPYAECSAALWAKYETVKIANLSKCKIENNVIIKTNLQTNTFTMHSLSSFFFVSRAAVFLLRRFLFLVVRFCCWLDRCGIKWMTPNEMRNAILGIIFLFPLHLYTKHVRLSMNVCVCCCFAKCYCTVWLFLLLLLLW